MGAQVTIGGDGTLFVGEDKTIRHEMLDAAGLPIDMAGWALSLVVKTRKGTVLLTETALITGVFNASRALNTQRAVFTMTDTELTIPAGSHKYSIKRTDDGNETITAYGVFLVEKTTQV